MIDTAAQNRCTGPSAADTPLFRTRGLPHVYKRGGFWRIALPMVASLPAREYWYINFAEVKVFFSHWSQV